MAGLKEFGSELSKANIQVLPRRVVLDGKGYVWESFLADAGWNERPLERRSGLVTGAFRLKSGAVVLDIDFDGHTAESVFPDEVVLSSEDVEIEP